MLQLQVYKILPSYSFQIRRTVSRHMQGSPVLQSVEFLKRRAVELPAEFTGRFDKIVCHVPSTGDRRALHRNEDNVFNPKTKRQRLRLPETQVNYLGSAFQVQTCPLTVTLVKVTQSSADWLQ